MGKSEKSLKKKNELNKKKEDSFLKFKLNNEIEKKLYLMSYFYSLKEFKKALNQCIMILEDCRFKEFLEDDIPLKRLLYVNKGLLHSEMLENNEAFESYMKAKSLGMKDYTLYNNLSIHYMEEGELEKALEVIEEGKIKGISSEINNNKNLATMYNTEATIYMKLELYEKAIEPIKKAIELDKDCIEPKTNLVTVYLNLNKLDEAHEIIETLIKENIKTPSIYNAKGGLYYKIADYEEALKNFEKALEIETSPIKQLEIYYNLALVYKQLNKLDEALTKYDLIIKSYPKNSMFAYLGKGNIYAKQHKNDEALKKYKEALEKFPNSAEVYNVIGGFYLENGDLKNALFNFSHAINLDINYEQAYNNRANVYFQTNNYLKALEDYEASLKLNPTSEITLYNKIILLKRIQTNESRNKILQVIQSGRRYENKNLAYELGSFLIEYYDQESSEEIKKEIISYLLENEFYIYVEILKKISIRINSISILDKEFEKKLKEKFRFKLVEQDIFRKMKKIDYENLYYMCKGINKYTIESLVNKGVYKNNVDNFNDPFDPYLKKYNTILNDECKKIKVTCFSEKDDNLLLWAHYADNHRGLCLGYKLNHELDKTSFDKVIYKEIETEFIEIRKLKQGNFGKYIYDNVELKENILTLKELYLRKHRDWAYENEYRLVHFDINNTDPYYKNLELKEIIFGMNTPNSDIELIKEIVKNTYANKKINFFQMNQGENLSLKKVKI